MWQLALCSEFAVWCTSQHVSLPPSPYVTTGDSWQCFLLLSNSGDVATKQKLLLHKKEVDVTIEACRSIFADVSTAEEKATALEALIVEDANVHLCT